MEEYTQYYKMCYMNLLVKCQKEYIISYGDVIFCFPIKSKTKITTCIKDLLEEAHILASNPYKYESQNYLANILRAIVYLIEIRDEVVGNRTFNGRRDYK